VDTIKHLVGKPKGLLPHSVVALPERGAKVRVVTESPAPLVASLHWVRRTCFNRLKSLPWTRHVLFGERREAVEVLFKDEILGKRTLVSADLTAATDRIPHSHAQALWKGIGRAIDLDPELLNVVIQSMGP